jgi:heat shock protein HslJ
MEKNNEIPPEVQITAFFSADGALTGNAGCNNYTSAYIAEGNVITIYPPSANKELCGEPFDSLEQAYLELLPQTANFEIREGFLVLLNNTGQEILRYLPVPTG